MDRVGKKRGHPAMMDNIETIARNLVLIGSSKMAPSYFKTRKLADEGLVKFEKRKPETGRGRPKNQPVLTEKGRKLIVEAYSH